MTLHAKPLPQQQRTQKLMQLLFGASPDQKETPLFGKTSRFGSDDAYEMPTELHKPKYQ